MSSLGIGVRSLCLVWLLLGGVSVPSRAVADEEFVVEHATPLAVYVGSGSLAGIETGDHMEVLRDGRPIALLEIVRTTEHSAYSRVLHQFVPVQPGDLVIPSTLEEVTVTDQLEPLPPPDMPVRLPRQLERERRQSEQLTTQLSGTLFVRQQQRQLSVVDTTRRWEESAARLSLVARDLGGNPFTFRARARARQRSQDFGSVEGLADQRIYELTLAWAPRNTRSWWQAGRISSRQEVGVGVVDGIAGQWGLSRSWGVGAFAGLNAEVDDDLFSSGRNKGGVFVSYATPGTRKGYAEVIVSAIGEYVPQGIDREYVFLQTRLGGRGRWSIYQQAEIDFNRGWRREASGESYQLSNVALASSVRISDRFRGTVSYDSRRRYRDWETNNLPEELFDRLLRGGFRATMLYRSRGGFNASLGAGLRGGEGEVEEIRSVTGSLNHGNVFGRRIFLGADLSAFQGESSEGYLVTLRARKYLRRGHDLGLTLGRSHSASELSLLPVDLSWVRLDGTVQLPFRLFLLGEVEVGVGVGEETEIRQLLQIGYRF